MMRINFYLLIGACLIGLLLIPWWFNAQGRGGGCYNPKGPFKQLSGKFRYDYYRYGSVGRDWESDCTREMPYAAVKAHGLNPEGGGGGGPSVEFVVWFLGPMKSDNPKCTVEISGGGEVKAIKEATRHYLNVIAGPKVFDGSATHHISNLQTEIPWTIRFNCTSE